MGYHHNPKVFHPHETFSAFFRLRWRIDRTCLIFRDRPTQEVLPPVGRSRKIKSFHHLCHQQIRLDVNHKNCRACPYANNATSIQCKRVTMIIHVKCILLMLVRGYFTTASVNTVPFTSAFCSLTVTKQEIYLDVFCIHTLLCPAGAL